jgi:hypothetical protein
MKLSFGKLFWKGKKRSVGAGTFCPSPVLAFYIPPCKKYLPASGTLACADGGIFFIDYLLFFIDYGLFFIDNLFS